MEGFMAREDVDQMIRTKNRIKRQNIGALRIFVDCREYCGRPDMMRR